jgi:hypothetical protein
MRAWPAAIALVAAVVPGAAHASPELGDLSELRIDISMVAGQIARTLHEVERFTGPFTLEQEARIELLDETAGQVGLAVLTLRAFADPWIEYELSVQNFGDDPLDGTLQILLDTSVFDESASARQTLSIELSDPDGDGASLLPNQFASLQSGTPAVHVLAPLDLYLLDVDAPVFLGDGVGQAGAAELETGAYAIPAVDPDLQAGDLWNSLILTLDFRLSPSDEATLRGGIVVVPEPGTALLLAGGLAACAVLGRRAGGRAAPRRA